MSGNDQLKPVFMPALAAILIHAEDVKGSPLTETEVLRIRDKATCIMMQVNDARKLEETRVRDIDPENCWHAWQNLRAELGRTPPLPAGPRFAQVRSSDEEYQQTIRDAQASLDQFRDLLRTSEMSGATPLVKTQLVEGERRAYMWLTNTRETEDGFIGELFEVPTNFQTYVVGDDVEVPESSVMDWLVNDDGILYGGFSLRYQRMQLPEAERAQYDEYVGVTRYA